MQIAIGPGETITIVLAIIAGCLWVRDQQGKTRESLVRIEFAVKQIPQIDQRVRELEFLAASQDPHRHKRMRPLSRALDEQEGGEET